MTNLKSGWLKNQRSIDPRKNNAADKSAKAELGIVDKNLLIQPGHQQASLDDLLQVFEVKMNAMAKDGHENTARALMKLVELFYNLGFDVRNGKIVVPVDVKMKLQTKVASMLFMFIQNRSRETSVAMAFDIDLEDIDLNGLDGGLLMTALGNHPAIMALISTIMPK